MQNNSRFLILDGLSLIRDYEDSGYASYRHVRELITDILASDLLNSPTNGDIAYEVLGRLESILAELPEPVLGGVTHPIAIYTANGQILLSGPSAGPNDLYGSMPNVGIKNLPSNAKNTVSYENIRTGNDMVNFHGESGFGRYYTRNTFDRIPKNTVSPYKKNPATRQIINPGNVVRYKARVEGNNLGNINTSLFSEGGKATRKARKSRKTRSRK